MRPVAPDVRGRPSAAASDNRNVELVGQFGGSCYAVDVQGRYAYLGMARRVIVLDVSDPSHPMPIGQTDLLPDLVVSLAVSGSHVYAAYGSNMSAQVASNGLSVIDVADPTNPRTVGTLATPRWATAVAMSGSYVYIVEGAGGRSDLRIVDVADPTRPREAGFYDVPDRAFDVAVVGEHAYLACLEIGLRIVRVADPANVVEVGSLDPPNFMGALRLAVSGHYAYLHSSCNYMLCLVTVDVADPTQPREASRFGRGIAITRMAVADGYLFVVSPHLGMVTFDLSNPAFPAESGLCAIPACVVALALSGNYAYVAATEEGGGLYIVDVSQPNAMALAGSYSECGAAQSVAVSDGYGYVAGNGLFVFDINDPSHAVRVGACAFPGGGGSVVVQGSRAYYGGLGLQVMDVSDPTRPRALGSCPVPSGVAGMAVEGRYAYVASRGLHIIDLVDAAHPREVGFYPVQEWARGVAVARNVAYLLATPWPEPKDAATTGASRLVASYSAGLHVLDVSDPLHPVQVGFLPDAGGSGAAIDGTWLYVAAGNSLRIVDVTDSAHPREAASLAMGAESVAVAGYMAYVGGWQGLHVVNVADPRRPQEVGVYGTSYDVLCTAVAGHAVYAANYYDGVLALRVLGRDQVRATIPPAGGGLTSSLGDTNFVFPAGAFTETVTLTYRHLWARSHVDARYGIRHAFDLGALYTATGQVAQLASGQVYTVAVHYTDAEQGPAIESTLALYGWDGSAWAREPSSRVDVRSNLVTAAPTHLSEWAVLGETRWTYLPVIWRRGESAAR